MTTAAQRGTTTVTGRAVRRIAERAASEALPGQVRTAGAAASVRGTRAEVSLGVTLPYPAPLGDTVRQVQSHVTTRTRHLTGLDVRSARVDVTSLRPTGPLSPAPAPPATPDSTGGRTPRYRWSPRRLPVALLTTAAAVGCGALTLDLLLVHLRERPAGGWRTGAVAWLSGHGAGDPAVIAAGGLVALTGVWMIVLALAPGQHRRSTVRTPAPGLEATVDRSAVTSLVRDAVAGVEGISAVRVRARGRRITVRARLAFGDRAATHAGARAAAHEVLAACHLRRGPRLRLTLVPDPSLAKASTAPDEVLPAVTPVPLSDHAAGGDR